MSRRCRDTLGKTRPERGVAETRYQALSRYCTILAAILHDIGKLTRQFQLKLIEADPRHAADYARHELISCVLVFRIIRSLIERGMSEREAIEQLRCPERIAECFREALNDPLFEPGHYQADQLFHEMRLATEMGQRYPLMAIILFLIGSHHKLAHGAISKGAIEILLHNHINAGVTDPERIALNRAFDPDKALFMADSASDFVQDAAIQFTGLHAAAGEDDIDYEALLSLTTYYNRVALILSDRVISSQADTSAPTDTAQFYANSRRDDDGKTRRYGQTLHDHLVQVGRQTDINFRRLMALIETDGLPSIDPQTLPEALQSAGLAPSDRFYWQDDMIRQLTARHAEGIKDAGFFGMVLAGTGTGKTRADAKAIAAISDVVRYTLAVGLRTLTLQTHTEYLDDVMLDERDVGVLIGSDVSKKLYELNHEDAMAERAGDGTDAAIEDDVDGEFVTPYAIDQVVDDSIAALLNPKEQSMLLYPVVVCTIDHVINVANMTRGRHLAASLRMMTSDLILDEVDSYSDADIVSVGKLVYRTAMAGRRVIVSSATMNPDIVESLHQAYEAGYRAYCQLTDKPCRLYAGWFSEYAEINRVVEVSAPGALEQQHGEYLAALSQQLESTPPRRIGEILRVGDCADEEAARERVLRACETLHAQHHTTCPETGVRLSCGIVRWNKIRHAINFTRFLLTASSPYLLRTLCYHSKQMAFVLDMQSEFLNQVLKRKDPMAIFRHPAIREAVAQAKAAGVKDILFIVASTSIEEVGRDHDFDYAITEPATYRSLIQLVGRVKRHRYDICHIPNVLVMDRPISKLEEAPAGMASPDVVAERIAEKMRDPSLRLSDRPEEAWETITPERVEEMMDRAVLKKIDARICLNGRATRADTLSLFEFGKREAALKGSVAGAGHTDCRLMSLQHYVTSATCQLSDFHYRVNRFRHSLESMIFYRTEDYGWMKVRDGDRHQQAMSANANVHRLNYSDPHGRLILRDGFDDRLDEIIERLGIHDNPVMKNSLQSISMEMYEDRDVNMLIRYTEALGAIRREQVS